MMVSASVSDRPPKVWRLFGGSVLFLILALSCLPSSHADVIYERLVHLHENAQGTLLQQGRDGLFYGMSGVRGYSKAITELFRLNSRGQRQVLRRFTLEEGVGFNSPPLMAGDGLIYWSSGFSGENRTGAIYRYDPRTARFTKLVDFPWNFLQGSRLTCIGPDGELYGICQRSLGNESGLIFRCTRRGELSVVYHFGSEQFPRIEPGSSGYAHLQRPMTLNLGSDGWLYGSTQSGGPSFLVQQFAGKFRRTYGALFRCTVSGEFQVIATFNPTTGNAPLGVVEGPDGALYGFVEHHQFRDSENRYKAQILRITKEGHVSILHAFPEHQPNGFTDHQSGPVLGGNSRMFAIRPGSGPDQTSRLFEFTPQGVVGDLFTFSRSDGNQPPGGLIFGSDGIFRGVAAGHYQRRYIFALRGDFGPPGPLPPIARDDYFVYRDKPTLLPVLRNDTKPAAWLTAFTQPASGKVSVAEDGKSLLFEPETSPHSFQRFTYTLSGDGGEAIATVYLRKPSKSGTYAGFLSVEDGSKYIRIRLKKSGLFTGVLFTNGRRFLLRGGLNEAGEYTFKATTELKEGITQVELMVRHDSTKPDTLNVTLQIGESVSQIRLKQQPNHTPEAAGLYTFALPPAVGQPVRYSGTGYGLLRITKTGQASAAGKLADRKAFSMGGHVTELDSVSLFNNLYRERGMPVPPSGFLRASIQLEPEAGKYDCSGEVLWKRPATYRNNHTIPALTQKQKLIGSRWNRGFNLVEPTSPDTPNVTAEAIIHDPAADTTVAVTLEGNRFFDPQGRLSGLTDPRTGLMAGIFIHPRSRIQTLFSGVLLPASGSAFGLFSTQEGTRTFELKTR